MTMAAKFEPMPYLTVVAMDRQGAIDFSHRMFGLRPNQIDRVVDMGAAGRPEKYKPGARIWHVYQKEVSKS